MSESNTDEPMIEIDKMSVDQFAGAVVLILGAIGSLLLVIWQSKCHCKVNLCWIFQCERRPPNEDEMKSLKDQAKKMNKKEDKILKKEEEILDEVEDQKTPRTPNLVPKKSRELEPEPEPEIDMSKLV
tara:strand:+ start:358 stop:741 length:384 start_codon:yes stop_codon:yes gene_type:complete